MKKKFLTAFLLFACTILLMSGVSASEAEETNSLKVTPGRTVSVVLPENVGSYTYNEDIVFLKGFSVDEYGVTTLLLACKDDIPMGTYDLLYIDGKADIGISVYGMGDANMDGDISARDAVLIKQAVVGMVDLSQTQRIFSNVYDNDDEVNVRDAVLVLQHVVGMDVTLGTPNGDSGVCSGATFEILDGYLYARYLDALDTPVNLGKVKGEDGVGILSIEKTSTEGLVDTYTITFTNDTQTTFTVTNGADGEQGIQGIQGVPGADGHTPVITIENGRWYIDGVDSGKTAEGVKGEDGVGILSIEKTSTEGLVDTYTITFTNGTQTTFTVTNGADGEQGKDGHAPKIPTRNLANLTFQNAILNNSTGAIYAPYNGINTAAAEEYIAVVGGENYAFSWAQNDVPSGIYIYQYDADKTFIGCFALKTNTSTAPFSAIRTMADNCAFIRVGLYCASNQQTWDELVPDNFQIERGAVVTPYVNPMAIDPDEIDYYPAIEQIIDAELALKYEEYGLPVLYLAGNTTGMSKDKKVTLSYKYEESIGTCTLKWQGSSSIAYPKKNYTIVFDGAFEAKDGWGEQKKYCLKANYIDFSHARNLGSAELWGDVVESRNNTDTPLADLPNGGAVDGFPVCVVINGEYQGLYTFNIPKDGWLFGMGEGEKEAVLCADMNQGNSPVTFHQTAETLDGVFDLEYVSDEENADWVLDSLNTLISACINSDGTDLDTTIAQYLDWESAIDYYIFCLITQNTDGIRKNYLLTTYDGVKWFFSAYDLDSTFGLYWDGSQFLKATDSLSVQSAANVHRIFELIQTYKADELQARYTELVINASGALSEENVIQTFLNFEATIPKALLDEEVKLWPKIPSTSVNNVSQIIDFYRRRVAWITPQIMALTQN